MGKKHAALGVEKTKDALRLVLRIDNRARFSQAIDSTQIDLKIAMRNGGICSFAYAANQKDFRAIDASFQAVEGVWIGAKVGVFCLKSENKEGDGHADFDYFRFAPME